MAATNVDNSHSLTALLRRGGRQLLTLGKVVVNTTVGQPGAVRRLSNNFRGGVWGAGQRKQLTPAPAEQGRKAMGVIYIRGSHWS